MTNRALALSPKQKGAVPAPRGPLMDAKAIVREFFTMEDGRVIRNERWVKEHMPHKVVLGHRTIAWYRNDVVEHLDRLRQAA